MSSRCIDGCGGMLIGGGDWRGKGGERECTREGGREGERKRPIIFLVIFTLLVIACFKNHARIYVHISKKRG